ncbi:MAG TPA: glycosyltransferase [Chthoniobacterales bacterium]|nr:glycosyltransferase [Chthoniobacterales bacterium]
MAGRNADQTGASGPLKVLHVIPSVSRSEGGPSYAVFAFARAANAAGNETLIATTGDDETGRNKEIECIFFRRDFQPYKISFSLRRWLDRHAREFDLVHIHALFSFSSRTAAHAAQKQRVPYIVRPLGVLNRWGLANRRPFLKRFWLRFVELPILTAAAAIHYTTDAERDEAAMIDPKIAQLRSFVVPIPVDLQMSDVKGQGSEFLQKYPQAAGKKIVLFLARLDEKKGLDLLLEAFASAKQEHPDSLLVIAGDGRARFVRGLHQQAERYGIAEHVLWTGFLGESEKAAAFSAATIYVLPSYSENFGIAAAEALASGVPTLLSDQVAIARDAANAKAAFVVPARVPELTRAIGQLLSDPKVREDLGRNAKLAAQRLFSPARVSDLLVSEYRRILGSNRTA